MRAFYVLLVAATAFLASCEALSLAKDSDQAHTSQLTSLRQNKVQAQRFLRTYKVTDDDEERGWANIFTIQRTKSEAIDIMGDWLNKRVPVKTVAQHLKVHSYKQNDQNFNALVEYVRMIHNRETGGELSHNGAMEYLRKMFNQ